MNENNITLNITFILNVDPRRYPGVESFLVSRNLEPHSLGVLKIVGVMIVVAKNFLSPFVKSDFYNESSPNQIDPYVRVCTSVCFPFLALLRLMCWRCLC